MRQLKLRQVDMLPMLSPAKPTRTWHIQAINHAVDNWGVDVISMSFGWPSSDFDGYDVLEKRSKRLMLTLRKLLWMYKRKPIMSGVFFPSQKVIFMK